MFIMHLRRNKQIIRVASAAVFLLILHSQLNFRRSLSILKHSNSNAKLSISTTATTESSNSPLQVPFRPISVSNVKSYASASTNQNAGVSSIDDAAVVELHYYWCGGVDFMFRHYLALLSATRKYRPFIVHFYAETLPKSAPYNFEWFEDAKNQIRTLVLHEKDVYKCSKETSLPGLEILISRLNSRCLNIILQQDAVVNGAFEVRLELNSSNLFVGSAITFNLINASPDLDLGLQLVNCESVDFESLNENCSNIKPQTLCQRKLYIERDVCLKFDSDIFVRDLPAANSSVAEFLRLQFYNASKIVNPALHRNEVVPRIAHYVFVAFDNFVERPLDFAFYLSILSAISFARVNCVYIHGNVKLGGVLWQDLVITRQLCVKWRYVPRPSWLWQHKVHRLVHFADIVRAQIFVEFGGLHLDPDVFIFQPLPANLWRYDAVIGLDAHVIAPRLGGIPRTQRSEVNLGLCLSSPGSEFFVKYAETQRNFQVNLWTYNSGTKALHVYERNPWLAYLASHVMVVCAGGKCYPGWARSEIQARSFADNPQRWIGVVSALHVVWPDLPEMTHPSHVTNSTNIFGNAVRSILAANGVRVGDLEILLASQNASSAISLLTPDIDIPWHP